MYARVIDRGRRRKLLVRFGGLPDSKQRMLPTLFGVRSAVGQCGPRGLPLSKTRNPLISRTPNPGRARGGPSGAAILFLRAVGERHAVPGPPGNAEATVRAFGHLFEQVGRGPVDEFHEE